MLSESTSPLAGLIRGLLSYAASVRLFGEEVWAATRGGVNNRVVAKGRAIMLPRVALLCVCIMLFSAPQQVSGKAKGRFRSTLQEEASDAKFILVGHLQNPRGTPKDGTTEFVVE